MPQCTGPHPQLIRSSLRKPLQHRGLDLHLIQARIATHLRFLMATTDRAPGRYRFGLFEVDQRRGEVRKKGLRIRLRGRPFDILLILLERRGELVTRDDLRARLWAADTFVDFDHGLNTSVNRLREILGDSAESPRFIETIPRKGYRFIAPVDIDSVDEAPVDVPSIAPVPAEAIEAPVVTRASVVRPRRRWLGWTAIAAILVIATIAALDWRTSGAPSTPAAATRMRLAVLPFQNLSGDADQEFFSDGFTEEMITELGVLDPDRLGVIARTTSMQYKRTQKAIGQIGSELGVDYVLEGSVRRAGDRLRISAELVEAKSQTQLWAESYDRRASDVIGIQTDVAMAIAKSLAPALSRRGAIAPRPAPTSFSAYELTLRGRFFREQATEASARKAIDQFERAIAIDPKYAPAHAGLGDAYRLLGAPGWEAQAPDELLKNARAAAARALELDPGSADAHAVMAMVLFTYDWNVDAAEREVREAMRLNPSLSRAHQYYSAILCVRRRFDEAIAAAHRAMELDPLSATAGTTLGVRLWYAGRIDEAMGEFRKTLEVNPSFAVAHWGLAQCYRVKGRIDDELDELTKAVTFSDNSAYMRAHLAYGYARSGDRGRALAIAKELASEAPARYVAPYHLALIAAGLGDHAETARWLERAYQDRSGWMVFLPVEPEFEQARQAPEIQRLLARVRPQS
jgi:TolB-like protein/DNA-binding winged helix-turn-helix (wHTH) protein/Tfp pilus assembly protein PilF